MSNTSNTNSLQYQNNYWDEPELKQQFIAFLTQMFNLDLTLWDQKGFWDYAYRPFSYFDGKKVASNVCVYSLDMMVKGHACRVAQVSAVGTLPEYRRQGLSIDLTNKALDWARDKHDFFFLFADEDAFGFYKKRGFREVYEHKARIYVNAKEQSPGAVRLHMDRAEDIELVHRLAKKRTAVSDELGVLNARLLMFWCLYALQDCVYYIPDLDAVVMWKNVDGVKTIYDVVGTSVPTFEQLYPYIAEPEDRQVEFRFIPDKMRVGEVEYIKVEGNGAHVMGTFPFEGSKFMFPFTAQA